MDPIDYVSTHHTGVGVTQPISIIEVAQLPGFVRDLLAFQLTDRIIDLPAVLFIVLPTFIGEQRLSGVKVCEFTSMTVY